MVKEKLFVCRECGYVFPKELSELIESKVQVYCEMCGTPFSLEGVKFRQPPIKYQKKPHEKYPRIVFSERSKSKLSKAIQIINKFAYLPLLIFSGITFGFLFLIFVSPSTNWLDILVPHLCFGISGTLIVIYDIKYISPKIRNEEYNEILLDAFCYGILGCIIFGVGTILLIKGILILIYCILNPKSKTHKIYHFGLNLKNSLNEFSAKAGFIIILFAVYGSYIGIIDIQFFLSFLEFINQRINTLDPWLINTILIIIITGFCLIPISFLIIDMRRKRKIRENEIFTFKEAFGTFLLGLLATIFFAIGIFILLKGILMFFLVAGKPADFYKVQEPIDIQKIRYPQSKTEKIPPMVISPHLDIPVEEEEVELPEAVEKKLVKDIKEKKTDEDIIKLKEKEIKFEEKKVVESKPIIKEEEEKTELRLHDSLLPVKDEKDKKTVKEYFSRIFNIISKDIRKEIMELEIPKKDKKEILKELAFLTENEQIKYLESLANLYRELPSKLISRIRKLPNVKPQHYDKIIEQLKYMDAEEQINFIQFLEKNA